MNNQDVPLRALRGTMGQEGTERDGKGRDGVVIPSCLVSSFFLEDGSLSRSSRFFFFGRTGQGSPYPLLQRAGMSSTGVPAVDRMYVNDLPVTAVCCNIFYAPM